MLTYPKEIVDALMKSQDKFVWEALQFPYYSRGKKWYLFMGLAAFVLVAYAVWTANFLFAIIILLFAITLLFIGNDEPTVTLAQIGDNGVVWDNRLYLFQDLREFAVIYQPPQSKVLYIEHQSMIKPRLRIPLEEQDPVLVREHLRQYLPEDLELRDEHLSDIVAQLLKI